MDQIRLRDVPLGSTVVDPTGVKYRLIRTHGPDQVLGWVAGGGAAYLSGALILLPRSTGVYVML